MNFLKENFKFLRSKSGLNQAQLSISLGFSRGAWNNYETGKSKPSLDDFIKISKHFGYSTSQILDIDLNNVEVNKNVPDSKIIKKAEVKHEENIEVNGKIKYYSPVFALNDQQADYGKNTTIIPLTDISVAAGLGLYNDSSYLENVESIAVPNSFLSRKQGTRLSVRVKGPSMAPTIYDGSYVSVRLLDRSEWAKMPDGLVYVVTDKDGKSYLKRVKNRFKNDFIVLTSDNPDKANFSNFNLQTDEIQWIWEAEFYMSFRMPNAQDSYYNKLIELEEKVDNLMNAQTKRLKEK
jgi:phage repressor protein C with HTH and peptisase S24 domain